MARRDMNYMIDYEDNGFGGNAMKQNEALANIINPPAPLPPPVPVPTPVAAPVPAPAFTDLLEYLFSLDVERDPERLPVAPSVKTPVEFQPSFIETDPERLPIAPPVETPVEPPVELLAPPVQTQPVTPKAPLSFADLAKLYQEKGATTRREETSEAGTQYYDDPTDLGEGWNAWENQGPQIGMEGQGQDATPIYGKPSLGGFSRKDGDFVNFYDTSGKLISRQKWNEGNLKSMWKDLGPLAMGAVTMGGGAGLIGSSLFPSLSGAAAAGAGGALAGGVNAALTDQDILKGALKGGLGSAGTVGLGDILGTDVNLGGKAVTLGDVSKAINFAQNPTLQGAVGLASPYIGNVNLGDSAISINDVTKGLSTAQALASGDPLKMFNAVVGVARSADTPTKSSFGPGDPDDFSAGLIPGYFQPGGEGYIPPDEEDPITVQQQPSGLDDFLKQLEQYKQAAVTPNDIQKIISGQNFATIDDIQNAMNTVDIPKGVSEQDVQSIVSQAFADNPNIKLADVQSIVDKAVSKIPTGLTEEGVSKIIRSQNFATIDDIQNAMNTVDIPKGVSEQDVQTIVSQAFADNPNIKLADVQSIVDSAVSKIPTGVSQDELTRSLGTTEQNVLAKFGAQGEEFRTLFDQYRQLGMDEDAATRQTIDDLGTNVGSRFEKQGEQFQTLFDQYRQLGLDEDAATRQTIDDLGTNVGSQFEDIGGQLSSLKTDVGSRFEKQGEQFETLLQQYRDLGMEESDAIRQTIDDLGANVGDIESSLEKTREDLFNRFGLSEEETAQRIADLETKFGGNFEDIESSLGKTREELLAEFGVTEDEINQRIADLETEFGGNFEDIEGSLEKTREELLAEFGLSEEEMAQRIADLETEFGGQLTSGLGKQSAETKALFQNLLSQQQAQEKAAAAQNTALTKALSQVQSTGDFNTLMTLLGSQQQPVQQAPMQDPYAHIKLMEDLFGSEIDLTPAGENTARRK